MLLLPGHAMWRGPERNAELQLELHGMQMSASVGDVNGCNHGDADGCRLMRQFRRIEA